MKKHCAVLPCVMVVMSISLASFAHAPQALETKMNNSQICAPLKFDAKDAFKLFGVDIPNIPGLDTKLAWDKNSHVVKSLGVDAHGKLSADLEVGCQPSDEGTVLKLVGKKGRDVRLVENVSCTGTVGQDRSVPDLDCQTSGAGAQFLNEIADLNGQLRPIFQSVLAINP